VPWLKLDDAFADHPKVDGLSDGAFRLHVAGLLYASRHLTDGEIPTRAVPRLTPAFETGHLDEVVDAGLWHEHDDRFALHDFLEWNPSAAEAKARRKARAEAGRKGGIASGRTRSSGSSSSNEANAEANARADARADRRTPSRPVPSRPSSSSSPPPTPASSTAPALEEEEAVEHQAEGLLRAACVVLAERALDLRSPDAPPLLNPTAWIRATAADRAEQHRERVARLIGTTSGPWTPPDLADALEPALAPARPAPARDPSCELCAGSLWHDVGSSGVVPCPRCAS